MPSDMHHPFVRKINALFEQKGVSAYRVSKDTGIPEATIGRWRNGEAIPNSKNVQILSEYFGVEPNYFFHYFTPVDPTPLITNAIKESSNILRASCDVSSITDEYNELEAKIELLESKINALKEEKTNSDKTEETNFFQKLINDKERELNKCLPRFEALRLQVEKFYIECEPLLIYTKFLKLSDDGKREAIRYIDYLVETESNKK